MTLLLSDVAVKSPMFPVVEVIDEALRILLREPSSREFERATAVAGALAEMEPIEMLSEVIDVAAVILFPDISSDLAAMSEAFDEVIRSNCPVPPDTVAVVEILLESKSSGLSTVRDAAADVSRLNSAVKPESLPTALIL